MEKEWCGADLFHQVSTCISFESASGVVQEMKKDWILGRETGKGRPPRLSWTVALRIHFCARVSDPAVNICVLVASSTPWLSFQVFWELWAGSVVLTKNDTWANPKSRLPFATSAPSSSLMLSISPFSPSFAFYFPYFILKRALEIITILACKTQYTLLQEYI